VLVIGGMWAAILTFALLARWITRSSGARSTQKAEAVLSPTMHAFGMFANALLIPFSMVIQRWLYGLPVASLHSVFSRVRFDLFARALLIIVRTFVVLNLMSSYLQPGESAVWRQSDSAVDACGDAPLRAVAGDGRGAWLRGLVFRVASSWERGPRTSLVLGIG
jgi:hypothetical protein